MVLEDAIETGPVVARQEHVVRAKPRIDGIVKSQLFRTPELTHVRSYS